MSVPKERRQPRKRKDSLEDGMETPESSILYKKVHDLCTEVNKLSKELEKLRTYVADISRRKHTGGK